MSRAALHHNVRYPLRRALARAVLCTTALVVAGCGAGQVTAVDAIGGVGSSRASQQAAQCDRGVGAACYWVGTWLLMTPSSPEQIAVAEGFIERACVAGVMPACRLQMTLIKESVQPRPVRRRGRRWRGRR